MQKSGRWQILVHRTITLMFSIPGVLLKSSAHLIGCWSSFGRAEMTAGSAVRILSTVEVSLGKTLNPENFSDCYSLHSAWLLNWFLFYNIHIFHQHTAFLKSQNNFTSFFVIQYNLILFNIIPHHPVSFNSITISIHIFHQYIAQFFTSFIPYPSTLIHII